MSSPVTKTSSSDQFESFVVTAPAKLILFGEHSVVYGKTAIAASIGLRIKLELRPNVEEDRICIDFSDIGVQKSWTCKEVRHGVFLYKPQSDSAEDGQAFQKAILKFLQSEGNTSDKLQLRSLVCFFYLLGTISENAIPLKAKVESKIPIGAGLGSSAALSVCLATGLLRIAGKCEPDKKEVCRLAHLSERILHGPLASGLDNNVSTFGGVIAFCSGTLTSRGPLPKLKLLLVNSHVERTTKSLLEFVRSQRRDSPTVVDAIMAAMDAVSKSCLVILEEMRQSGISNNHHRQLGNLIDYNQSLLESLKVSHPSLQEIIEIARQHGLHGKLTGAGGGGFAVILVPPDVDGETVAEVRKRLDAANFSSWEIELDPEGVLVNKEETV